jgi:hypothetical protein
MMTKKLSISFLSVALAFGILLTGCSDSQADSEANKDVAQQQEQQEQQAVTEEEDSLDKITVSPENEKLIKDALEQAKQGKAVTVDDKYKQVSWGEIKKVLGEPVAAGPEDGGAMTFDADEHQITFKFNCHDSCVHSEDETLATKLVEISVDKK